MTKEHLASLLNGRQYMDEIERQEEADAKKHGLVVVFGYSDDNVEFRGVFNDEFGCYGGGTFYLRKTGIVKDPSQGECKHCAERFERECESAARLEAVWGGGDDFAWTYKTDIPHATFEIMDDLEKLCLGIVFSINDLP